MKKLFAAIALSALVIGLAHAPASAQEATSPAEQKRLFRQGAELWPIYCAQCHSPRPPGDYASYQWDILLAHMRTLGNIPASDANAITAYLKGGR